MDHMRIAQIGPARGGIGNAAQRLHLGLRRIGVDSQYFGPATMVPDPENAIVPLPAPSLPVKIVDRAARWVNRSLLHLDQLIHVPSLEWDFSGFDVIHLHGMDRHFNLFRLRRLSRKQAVVWALHDKNIATGACGFSEVWNNCERWRTGCGQCPKAKAKRWPLDLTAFLFLRRQRVIQSTDIVFVALNTWMRDFAQNSPILRTQRVEVIPNGVDTEQFTPRPATMARARFGLPVDTRLLLSVLTNFSEPRKGAQYYPQVLRAMKQYAPDSKVELVLIGSRVPDTLRVDLQSILPIHTLGHISDMTQLAALYSAADLHVITPVIDNFPNTILESLACGTPVAGFGVGGIPDMVTPEVGILAPLGDVEKLGRLIAGLLDAPDQLQEMRERCRAVATTKFSLELQATRHLELYQSLTKAE